MTRHPKSSRVRDIDPSIIQELSSIEANAAGKPKRRLTSGEVCMLRTIYGDAVNYKAIEVFNGGILTALGSAVTINAMISFPDYWYSDDFSADPYAVSSFALLTHEVCHVWQWQNPDLKYFWLRALLEHFKYGDKVYDFTPQKNKKLTKYRFEQQGAILQRYYMLRAFESPELPLYESIIYSVIPRPPPGACSMTFPGWPPSKQPVGIPM